MSLRTPAALLAAVVVAAGVSVSSAHDSHDYAPTPAESAAAPAPAIVESHVAPHAYVETSHEVVCCPIEVVRERVAHSARKAYRCHGPGQPQVLCVANPADCTGKHYSVPVCVPACCVGEPVCCGTKVGPLGRGYVTYQWPCGFEATIAFRVHGGVVIVYR